MIEGYKQGCSHPLAVNKKLTIVYHRFDIVWDQVLWCCGLSTKLRWRRLGGLTIVALCGTTFYKTGNCLTASSVSSGSGDDHYKHPHTMTGQYIDRITIIRTMWSLHANNVNLSRGFASASILGDKFFPET